MAGIVGDDKLLNLLFCTLIFLVSLAPPSLLATPIALISYSLLHLVAYMYWNSQLVSSQIEKNAIGKKSRYQETVQTHTNHFKQVKFVNLSISAVIGFAKESTDFHEKLQ